MKTNGIKTPESVPAGDSEECVSSIETSGEISLIRGAVSVSFSPF